jgi:hypothetical protein
MTILPNNCSRDSIAYIHLIKIKMTIVPKSLQWV